MAQLPSQLLSKVTHYRSSSTNGLDSVNHCGTCKARCAVLETPRHSPACTVAQCMHEAGKA